MRLQQVIRQHYLWSALVPILLVESTLVILYFVSTAFISHKQADALLDKAQQDIRLLLNKQTKVISLQFSGVSHQLGLLQSHFRGFYALSDQRLRSSIPPEKLILHENGSYFVASTGNNCALYFSPSEPADSTKVMDRVARTAYFDTLIAKAVYSDPLVVQGYINEPNLCRICPYIENTPEVFGPQMDMTKENFYYLADQWYNPDRHNVWTEPYNDPAGGGWMVSVITPVYVEDELMAVGGLDITLKTLIQHLLSIKLPWSMQALLLDQSGNILAIPEGLKALLLESETEETPWKNIQADVFFTRAISTVSSH